MKKILIKFNGLPVDKQEKIVLGANWHKFVPETLRTMASMYMDNLDNYIQIELIKGNNVAADSKAAVYQKNLILLQQRKLM